MINLIAHALTNQKTFSDPRFVADPNFVPAVLSQRAAAFSQALYLNFENNLYYLKIYLAILAAYPDLKAQFGPVVESYFLTDLIPRGAWIDGAELYPVPGAAGFYTDPPGNLLPVNQVYNITYQQGSVCQIAAQQTGIVRSATYELLPGTDAEILSIAWPKDIPFRGMLKLTQPWIPNALIRIEVEPSHFPYKLLLQTLSSYTYLNELLVNFGMIDAYSCATEPTEQLAIILTLVGLANPAIQPA